MTAEYSPHSVCMYVCILYGSESKQRLFPYSPLVFITETECVYCAVGTEYLY